MTGKPGAAICGTTGCGVKLLQSYLLRLVWNLLPGMNVRLLSITRNFGMVESYSIISLFSK